ncbi:MAG: hypothetical protein EHM83_07190 [Burkholderiales bacterium]|nr:MAG: hypothetical protein EHM83_07190 [Burkholderiales bacterium]
MTRTTTSTGAAVKASRADRRRRDLRCRQARSLEAEFRGFDWGSIALMLDPVFPRSGLIDGDKARQALDQAMPSLPLA